MRKNSKGFTLIELLAVIVVLAIIALIATPIVLNLINEAKVGAAESSSTAYIKAFENSVLTEMVKNPDVVICDSYTVSGKTATCASGSATIAVDVDGTVPKSGTITMSDRAVQSAVLEVSGYTINYANGKSTRS